MRTSLLVSLATCAVAVAACAAADVATPARLVKGATKCPTAAVESVAPFRTQNSNDGATPEEAASKYAGLSRQEHFERAVVSARRVLLRVIDNSRMTVRFVDVSESARGWFVSGTERCIPAVDRGRTLPLPRSRTSVIRSSLSGPRFAEPILKLKAVDASHLFVSYRRPHCQTSAGHDVVFTRSDVTVTMYSVDSGIAGCQGGISEGSDTVALGEPLAGRRVVDGACGDGQLLAESTDCQRGFITE
jgi:hypothetical protein